MNPAIHAENGYCHLADIGVLALSGRDAARLLQGQTTCDIFGLAPGQTTLGAICTPQGRVIAVFRVLRSEERIFLLLPKEIVETARKRLALFVLRSDVSIEDATARWAVFGLLGEQSADALQALGLPPLIQENEAEGQSGYCLSFYAIRIPDPATPRLMILVDSAKAAGLGRSLESHGFQRLEASRWRLEDIRSGLPSVVSATVEAFLPQMLNLDRLGGVSFTKGCYTGQEIIARAHYLGKLKQRMFRLMQPEGPIPKAGDALFVLDGQAAGRVVAAEPSSQSGAEILAVLYLSQVESGSTLFKDTGDNAMVLAESPYSLPVE